jgi:excisionase family DNA binding protein
MADLVQARTVKGFCAAYGVGVTRTYELINQGKLVAIKDGRKTLILESSARAWLEGLQARMVKETA